MKTQVGIVTVAQEGRFRLITSEGRSHMFLLGADCAVEAQDLPVLVRDQRRVRVSYNPADHLMAGIVHAMQALAQGER